MGSSCFSDVSVPLTQTFPRARTARAYLIDLWNRREFAWFLAMGNMKARNASTVFGLFWWVLNPLLLGMVYFLVFGVIWEGRRPDDFLPYLLSGMFVFNFTALSMTGGANSIIQNSKLLVNLRFPRLILPIAALIESAFGFLVSLGVIFVILIPTGPYPGIEMLWLLVAFPLHLMFNLGLGAITARLAVPFRDINNFVPYVNRLWLYLSPIIWPLSFLDNQGETLRNLMHLNPMFNLIALYRTAILQYPLDPAALWSAMIWAVAMFVVGVALFVKYEGRMARYL